MDIEYNQAYQEFIEVLTDMKRSIDRYEQKPDADKKWIATRKTKLASIFHYSKIAHRTASILSEQISQAYTDGYRRGRESVERANNNAESPRQLRAKWGNETFRRQHNNIQINKWADLH